MLQTLAVAGYRSLFDLTLPMARLNLVIGDNGSGKSSLYRVLRLLAATARDGVGKALAEEGGLESALWAGPEHISRRMMSGEVPLQGSVRSRPVSLRLGFATDTFGYAIDVGLPVPSQSLFDHDPQIKCESVWAGPFRRDGNVLLERRAGSVRRRAGHGWEVLEQTLASFDSVFSQLADPQRMPELFMLREYIRQWRFHHQFRSDAAAPARQPCMGIRTPVLSDDGHDLPAAWQTIIEIGDDAGLKASLRDAFPGARVQIDGNDGRLSLRFHQPGLLRPLSAAAGAQRTGNQPASRPAAGAGALDHWCIGTQPGVGGVACLAPDRGAQGAPGLQRAALVQGTQPDPCGRHGQPGRPALVLAAALISRSACPRPRQAVPGSTADAGTRRPG